MDAYKAVILKMEDFSEDYKLIEEKLSILENKRIDALDFDKETYNPQHLMAERDIEQEKLTEHGIYKDVLLKLWTMKSKYEKQSFISKFIDTATLKKNKDGSFEIDKINFRSSFIEQIDKLYDKGIVDVPSMIERDSKFEDIKVSVNMNKDQLDDYLSTLKKELDISYMDLGEYWYARELMKILEYNKWENFEKVINKAKDACKNSGISVFEHFPDVRKLSKRANNAEIEIKDYKLTRYACYLIAQNGDSRKKVIALAQTYFAVQTRKQEITEKEYSMLTEDEKRFYQRNLTRKGNYSLNQTAKKAGVKNFDKFHNAGYKGLYNGETADDIAKRKGLRYREDILDNMGSDELIANLFRISQTEQRLKRDNVDTEKKACDTHNKIGKIVRKAIKEAGGTMPEDLPTPKKSLKQLEKEKIKQLKSKNDLY